MKTLVLSILLIASTQGISAKPTRSDKRLPAPASTRMITFRPHGIIYMWKPVKSDLEPVFGYKVKLWEAQEKKIHIFETVDGEEVLTVRTELPTLTDFKPSDGKYSEYRLTGPDHEKLIIKNIKAETPYLFQVLAFGPSGDGEPTSLVGVQLGGSRNDILTA